MCIVFDTWYWWWELLLSTAAGYTTNSSQFLGMSLDHAMVMLNLKNMLKKYKIVCIPSVWIQSGLEHPINWTSSTHTKWNLLSSLVLLRWLWVFCILYRYFLEVFEHRLLEKLCRYLLRMASPANLLLLHFRIHVHSDHHQMDHPLGYWERCLWSSLHHRSDDRPAPESRINRRKTSLGYWVPIKHAILAADDCSYLRPLDAHLQAHYPLDQNALPPQKSSSAFQRRRPLRRWWGPSTPQWSWSTPQHGRWTRIIQSWSWTWQRWRWTRIRTWHQLNSSPPDHWNNRIRTGKYLQHSFLPSSVGPVVGSRSTGSCLFGEDDRRRHSQRQRLDNPGWNVLLRVDHGRSHHGYGLHGMLPARTSSAVGGV